MEDYRSKIIIQYLQGYAPVNVIEEDVIIKTSAEIADDLADICTLSVDNIAAIMMIMNFTLSNVYGTPGWMMKKK